MNDRSRVETAAFDQTHRQQLFEVAVIDEGTRRSDLFAVGFSIERELVKLRIDRTSLEGGKTGDAQRPLPRNHHQSGIAAFDVDRLRRGEGESGFILLHDAGFADHIKVGQRTAVDNRRLHSVHFDDAVVDVPRIERRHDMLDGENDRLAVGDGGAAADIHHIAGQRADLRFAGQIHPAEDDAGVLRRGLNPHRSPGAGMECDSGNGRRSHQSLLFFHR